MKKILFILLTIFIFAVMGFSIYKILNPEPEGYKRQEVERDLADQFLQMVRGETDEMVKADKNLEIKVIDEADVWKDIHEMDPVEQSRYAEYLDENYYSRDGITFTPDYAKGYLQCVLEIPKETVQIRRGVYSGTREDIAYDLAIWMVTAARPDYELGKTHYVIYGHNHTEQNLSFNKLKNVEVGDEFFLTDTKAEYTYEVTGVLKMTRGDVAKQLVDNFNLSPDLCYIVTCGRNEMRYYDLVVEGKVKTVKYFEK